jgi:AraC family transcriptional regulator
VKGEIVIAELNTLIDIIESRLSGQANPAHPMAGSSVDVSELAARARHHRVSPASDVLVTGGDCPSPNMSADVRMTVAAGDVIGGEDLLSVAVRHGYGSIEAFGRAFRSVHGAGPSEVRRNGGPLRSQSKPSGCA